MTMLVLEKVLALAAVVSPLLKSVTLSTFRTSPPYSFGTLWKPFATLSEKSIGDLKPAPTIRARPFPVSTAESTCIFFKLSAKFEDEPVSVRVGPMLEEELFRLGPPASGDKSRPQSRDGDRERCAEAENASVMKADLCEGDPGASARMLDFSSIPGDCTTGGVLSPLIIEDAPVAVRDVVDRPGRLKSSALDVLSEPCALSLPFFEAALASGWMLSNFNVCMGISATPIIIDVAVPVSALAAPETGSQGPSSV